MGYEVKERTLSFETRKILAAFYTNPIAADILTGLTIDNANDTVIDPACGSGTLLVSSYKRKMELADTQNVEKIHKQFVENDITGIDIMPFAAHLTAINLSSQSINVKTNKLRVGVHDSLELVPNMSIDPFSKEFQLTMKDYGLNQRITKYGKTKGAVGIDGKGEPFKIQKVDIVIMNPPFTDREKMPKDFRDKLLAKSKDPKANGKIKALIDVCGSQINLWGYFLVLADRLLKDNGKIGAVIPINILRGGASDKIRDFVLRNYHIEYIMKSTVDKAFSEGAAFTDVLLIMEKRKPKTSDITKIVLLKKSLKNISSDEIKFIEQTVKNLDNYSNELLECKSVKQSELLDNRNNLMVFIGASQTSILREFLDIIEERSKIELVNIKKEWIRQGLHTSPKGLSELIYVTNPADESRTKRAFLILEKEKENKIYFHIKNTNFKFSVIKEKTVYGIRTITGLRQIDTTNAQDYLITDEFTGFDKVLMHSKWKTKESFEWNNVNRKLKGLDVNFAIATRFRPNSNNTSLTAIFSKVKTIPNQSFRAFVYGNEEYAMILSLYFNSIIYLTFMMLNKKQTQGGFAEIVHHDLVNFKIPEFIKIGKEDSKKFKKLFDRISKVKFPSLLRQLQNNFPERQEIDTELLRILGFSDKEIFQWLPKLYDAIVKEMKGMKY